MRPATTPRNPPGDVDFILADLDYAEANISYANYGSLTLPTSHVYMV